MSVRSPPSNFATSMHATNDRPILLSSSPNPNSLDMASSLFSNQLEETPLSSEKLFKKALRLDQDLAQLEALCIDRVVSLTTQIWQSENLGEEQYQELMKLHQELLFSHREFFLTCAHHLSTPTLRKQTAELLMPMRIWRYCIFSFLDYLRQRLPASYKHMLKFALSAYGTTTSLYETVPVFAETSNENLGDLSRYIAALKNGNTEDRETWASASRSWYLKAANRSPEVGRLYHHMALLAKPDALQQLCYYSKSLCVSRPFPRACKSMMPFFKSNLAKTSSSDTWDTDFVKVHALLFDGLEHEELESCIETICGTLDTHIEGSGKKWLQPGYYIAISLICSLLGYGATANPLGKFLPVGELDADAESDLNPAAERNIGEITIPQRFQTAKSLFMQTCNIVFSRKTDTNCLPFFHTILVFLYYLARNPEAMQLVENEVPWNRIVDVLNEAYAELTKAGLPLEGSSRPLPEDYIMRGFAFSKHYFLCVWFDSAETEHDERMLELPSLEFERLKRLVSIGQLMCLEGKWFTWDEASKLYAVTPAYDGLIEPPSET